jgi:hypothetical protein
MMHAANRWWLLLQFMEDDRCIGFALELSLAKGRVFYAFPTPVGAELLQGIDCASGSNCNDFAG